MKITKIEAVYPSYKTSLAGWRPNLWQIIIKIHTDKNEVYGYGTGGGGNASIEIINGHLSNFLINKDINNLSDITNLFDKLFFESIPYGRSGIALMAISAIDLAIWDAYSKYYESPIKNLLNDQKNHKKNIRTYATGNNVSEYYSLGLQDFKLSIKSKDDFNNESKELINLIKGIKSKFPNSKKIMIDCYMSWDRKYTQMMSNKLSEIGLEWIEDISTPDKMLIEDSMIDNLNGIKLAGGEHDFNYNNFEIMLKNKTYDIWQPDITWCGGISSILKIVDINKKKYKIFLHRGGEPWGLPLIESGIVDNMAELHNPKSKNLQMEQWNNKTIKSLEDGILITEEYLGFGADPVEGIF